MSESRCVRNAAGDRFDDRGEWFREWDVYASFIHIPPRWYWVGMILSAIWIASYLLIYPSIPLLTTHWKGLGVPGGCRPWSAICEMRQEQAVLDEVRGAYLDRIRATPVIAVVEDVQLSAFVGRAARVLYADNCAACHGEHGAGIAALPGLAPVLNDDTWLHGGSVQAIEQSIRNQAIHPFGLAGRTDDLSARMLAVYVYKRMW